MARAATRNRSIAAPGTARAEPGSVARRVGRQVRQHYREGKVAVGERRWRAWWRLIGVSSVGMILLMAGLARGVRAMVESGTLAGEPQALRWLGENGPFSFSTAVFFQAFGTDITLIMLVGIAAGIAAWNRRSLIALSLISAFVVVDAIVRFGWFIWARARPVVLHDGFASPGFHAFPSGHTAKTAAVYGFLTLLWVLGSRSVLERIIAMAAFVFIAVVVPIGRLSMGVHWPSDVVGGFIIGAAWLGVLAYGLRYERRATDPDLP